MKASTENVLLGRPGELLGASPPGYQATRIGGSPDLPPCCKSPPAELTQCKCCGEQQLLLLQAHAPVSANQAGTAVDNRVLCLFGCVSEQCKLGSGSWRLLRCQWGSPQQPQPTQRQHQQQQPQQPQQGDGWLSSASFGGVADDWGLGGGGGWGMDDGDTAAAPPSAGGSSFGFDDLNAALDSIQEQQQQQQQQLLEAQKAVGSGSTGAAASTAQPEAADSNNSGNSMPPPDSGAATAAAAGAAAAAAAQLPAFYLYSEAEAGHAGRRSLPAAADEHVQQLLQQYEAESEGAGSAKGPSASSAAAAAAAACMPAVEGGGETWGGEGYEKEAVLLLPHVKQAAADAAFLKFSRRLARCPDQCARYSFGGEPLWPGAEVPQAQPCAACGAPRVFEVQLMAPTIHFLHESLEWLAGSSSGGSSLVAPPATWDWLTVVGFSCSRSCSPAAGCFVEEEAAAAREQ